MVSFKYPSYRKKWYERFGFISWKKTNHPIIWLHAVSVGEVNASKPIVKLLLKKYKHYKIIITTVTPTGAETVIQQYGDNVSNFYLPYDIPFCVKKFIRTINPSILITMETEIWPNLIEICDKRDIFISLVNARLSEKSKQNYEWIKFLISPALKKIDLVIAQYKSDADRFKKINDTTKISLCGNLKFDQDIPDQIEAISASIRQSWAVDGKVRPTLIAASTHETEERFVIDSFLEIISKEENSLLILVPRHPERFDDVYGQILEANLEVARRSKKEDVTRSTKVLLGDTMGELNFLYSVSDIAFVGGSLIDHGGQNLLEPAALGLPISSGSSLRNFQEIADELKRDEALLVLNSPSDLSNYFIRLGTNPEEMKKKGQASKKIFCLLYTSDAADE